MSVKHPSRATASERRSSDLRFAASISAGLIATVLTLGALLAPMVGSSGGEPAAPHAREQTVRLPPASALTIVNAQRERPTQARLTTPAAVQRAASGIVIGSPRINGVVVPVGGSSPAAPRSTGGAPAPRHERSPADLRANAARDTDGDGMPDVWELRHGLNPTDSSDAAADTDNDGVDNLAELHLRMAPDVLDSDGNGVADGDEDADHDGLRNRTEQHIGSNPAASDSNGDGQPDAQDDADGDGAANIIEQQLGTDPGSEQDVPAEAVDKPSPAVTEPDTHVEDGGDDASPPPPAPAADDDAHPAATLPEPETPHHAPGADHGSSGGGDGAHADPGPPADQQPAAPAPAPAPAAEATPAPAPAAPPAPAVAPAPASAPAPAPAPVAPAPAVQSQGSDDDDAQVEDEHGSGHGHGHRYD